MVSDWDVKTVTKAYRLQFAYTLLLMLRRGGMPSRYFLVPKKGSSLQPILDGARFGGLW